MVLAVLGAAPTGGGLRTLSGTNLGVGFPAAVRVLVDGVPLVPASLARNGSLDAVTVAFPSGVGAGHSVVVTVSGEARGGGVTFAYDPPSLVKAGLYALSRAGGDVVYGVYLAGANFGGPAAAAAGRVVVSVGGAPCALLSVADASITCATAAPAGDVLVVVGDQPAVSHVFFNASLPVRPPALADITGAWLSLSGGGTLTLTGVDLSPGAPAVTVVVAAERAAPIDAPTLCRLARRLIAGGLTSNWCTSLVATGGGALACATPPWPRATLSLHVVVVGLMSCAATAPGRVFLMDPPRVAAIAPAALPSAGGAHLEVTGSGFEEGTLVFIGDAPCRPLSVAAGRIVCVAPAGAAPRASVATTSPAYGRRPQPGVVVGCVRAIRVCVSVWAAPFDICVSVWAAPFDIICATAMYHVTAAHSRIHFPCGPRLGIYAYPALRATGCMRVWLSRIRAPFDACAPRVRHVTECMRVWLSRVRAPFDACARAGTARPSCSSCPRASAARAATALRRSRARTFPRRRAWSSAPRRRQSCPCPPRTTR